MYRKYQIKKGEAYLSVIIINHSDSPFDSFFILCFCSVTLFVIIEELAMRMY